MLFSIRRGLGAFSVNRRSHGNECVAMAMTEGLVQNGHDGGDGGKSGCGLGEVREGGREETGREGRKYSLRETEKRLKRQLQTKSGAAGTFVLLLFKMGKNSYFFEMKMFNPSETRVMPTAKRRKESAVVLTATPPPSLPLSARSETPPQTTTNSCSPPRISTPATLIVTPLALQKFRLPPKSSPPRHTTNPSRSTPEDTNRTPKVSSDLLYGEGERLYSNSCPPLSIGTRIRTRSQTSSVGSTPTTFDPLLRKISLEEGGQRQRSKKLLEIFFSKLAQKSLLNGQVAMDTSSSSSDHGSDASDSSEPSPRRKLRGSPEKISSRGATRINTSRTPICSFYHRPGGMITRSQMKTYYTHPSSQGYWLKGERREFRMS